MAYGRRLPGVHEVVGRRAVNPIGEDAVRLARVHTLRHPAVCEATPIPLPMIGHTGQK
jgi:hypothetical protein